MPIGSIPSNRRLGIANVSVRNASSFASTILRLPSNIPIYQQQLVHSQEWAGGPAKAAAEWCPQPDSEQSLNTTIREISAHDTVFSRRNLSDPYPIDFVWHRSAYTNQLYYVGNEPETGSTLSNNITCPSNCWNPRDFYIDGHISGCFPNPDSQFWESQDFGFTWDCTLQPPVYKRIRKEALAFVYLRLWWENHWLGRGHILIHPSATKCSLGAYDPDSELDSYWEWFYYYVHNGVTIGSYSEQGITPQDLKVLHVHAYALKPYNYSLTPIQSVAFSATDIRRGADWYRNTHYGGNPLPMDILVSEMGPHFEISKDRPGLEWSGGWPGFCTGLTWWNTYLCWLTRQGPMECNLQNWETGQHTIHACIHAANLPPFATTNNPNHQRNQWYFNSDTWSTYVYNNANMLQYTQLVNETNFQTFENSFSAYNTINWDGRTWRSTPFGVCYTVWANVGPDPISGNLATGWVSSTQSGVVGSASVNLPSGYSTVYFPIIKNMGAFSAGTQINIRWIRPSDGAVHDRGTMDMHDFSDSEIIYEYYGYSQYTYAAMVYPVVCYASSARTVTVQLSRNISGTQIWLGRPIVLPEACSWFITQ